MYVGMYVCMYVCVCRYVVCSVCNVCNVRSSTYIYIFLLLKNWRRKKSLVSRVARRQTG